MEKQCGNCRHIWTDSVDDQTQGDCANEESPMFEMRLSRESFCSLWDGECGEPGETEAAQFQQERREEQGREVLEGQNDNDMG